MYSNTIEIHRKTFSPRSPLLKTARSNFQPWCVNSTLIISIIIALNRRFVLTLTIREKAKLLTACYETNLISTYCINNARPRVVKSTCERVIVAIHPVGNVANRGSLFQGRSTHPRVIYFRVLAWKARDREIYFAAENSDPKRVMFRIEFAHYALLRVLLLLFLFRFMAVIGHRRFVHSLPF